MEMDIEGWGKLGMFTWGRKGSRVTSEPFPVPEGAPGALERDQGQVPNAGVSWEFPAVNASLAA